MAFFHCLLSGTGTSGDGSTWADDSSGTAAFIGAAGLVSAAAGAADGDTIYVKDTDSVSVAVTIVGNETVAGVTNPILIIGVKTGTTNLAGSVVQSDLIPGLRTGQATRAYAWGGGTVPQVTTTGTSDIILRGNLYIYGMIFQSVDNLNIASGNSGPNRILLDEVQCSVTGSNDQLIFGQQENTNNAEEICATHCRFDAAGGELGLSGRGMPCLYACEIDSTNATAGWYGFEFTGELRMFGCDLTGSGANVFDISDWHAAYGELNNCRMPTSHVLTVGTATQPYCVANYGSGVQTGLTSADSSQELEIETLEGTVDLETVKVRTGGADDGAAGLFSWAMAVNNVADNVVGVVSPWMHIWVDGDGTAKTLTVFIANDAAELAANLIEDDEAFLEVLYPSEAGISMYDYRPNSEAPTGFGKMQLLGTAADLTTTTETWGTGANNDQKFTATIDPDYQGWVYCRVHYSKASGPTLYVDPKPEIT